MIASKIRWAVFAGSVQDREPFHYRNFKAATTRFIANIKLILKEGPYWLGCRFRSPIIWYPPKGYRATYEFLEGEERTTFALLAQHHGFKPIFDAPSPAYSLTALHRNCLFS